ncbi:MAG: hypothetical protein PVI44_09635 [Balneolaceae bacterium]|jgi:hypothetical protein
MRKSIPSLSVFLTLVLGILLGQGCQSTVTPDANENASIDPAQSLRFTGRDSLIARPGGVALIAKVSGDLQAAEDQDCAPPSLYLSGTGKGQATHLGQTMVEQTACIAENGEVRGTFTYEGRTGGTISGTYEGTLEGGELTADVTVETASVSAPRETPPAGENWGGGQIKGTMTASGFNYEFVGWLFHHETDE